MLFNNKKMIVLSMIVLNLLVNSPAYSTGDTLISGPNVAVLEINSGKIQGYIHNDIVTYRGIPYATAERFEAPKPIEKWAGVKLALENGNIAPQNPYNPMDTIFFSGPSLVQSENCQNLNVWTPSITDNKKRPVMVWLHGGGFQAGSSMESYSYDGENLSKKGDVVVVSVNHRLNIMGFLDLSAYGEKYKTSSNNGMLDIVEALKWVKENISQFGGDPNNVTIFGESGGGAKVLTLMGMPSAKGLFHKGIVQSGTTGNGGMTFTMPEVSKRVTENVLEYLQIKGNEVEKLKEIPYSKLEEAGNYALQKTADEFKIENLTKTGYGLLWRPTLDGEIISSFKVGEELPIQSKDIPLLVGSNLTEWNTIYAGFFDDNNLVKSQSENKNTWTPEEINKKIEEKYKDKSEAVITAFKKAYPNRNLADVLYVDTFLRNPALKVAKLKSDQKGANVYNYLFAWETPLMGGFAMSYHTSEIPFVFDNARSYEVATGGGKEAISLADKMSRAWISFARTGNPNVEGLPEWKPYTRESGNTMVFDNNSEVLQHHDEQLMRLLDPDFEF